MAVTATVKEAYGATPTIVTPYQLNFLSADATSGVDSSASTTALTTSPIAIPASAYAYSYERWFYLLFGGNSNAITSIYVWKSAGTYNTGYKVKAKSKAATPTTYVQSIATASTLIGVGGNEANTTNDIPTSQGAGLAPAYNASGTKSDYMIAQLVVASGATPGPMVSDTFTISYQYNTTG